MDDTSDLLRKTGIGREIARAAHRSVVDEFYTMAATGSPFWMWHAVQLWRAAEILADEARAASLEHERTRARPELSISPDPQPLPELWLRTGLLQPALLLAGLATECLLKGLISERQGEWVLTDLDGSRTYRHKSHKLVKLSAMAGVSLTKAEQEVLEILTQFVEWAGKYPIPLTPEGMCLPPGDSDKEDSLPRWVPGCADLDTFSTTETIFFRLLETRGVHSGDVPTP